MSFFWLVQLGLVVAILALASICVRAVRERTRLRGLWTNGLTAQATVTREWTVERVENLEQHHAYEFTAADGRTVRLEESGGPSSRRVGDLVRVYYLPGRPEGATATQPGDGSGGGTAAIVVALAATAVLLAVLIDSL